MLSEQIYGFDTIRLIEKAEEIGNLLQTGNPSLIIETLIQFLMQFGHRHSVVVS